MRKRNDPLKVSFMYVSKLCHIHYDIVPGFHDDIRKGGILHFSKLKRLWNCFNFFLTLAITEKRIKTLLPFNSSK